MEGYVPIFGYKTKNYELSRIFIHGTVQKVTFKTAASNRKMRILLTNKYSPRTLRVYKMFVTINDINYPVTLKGKKCFKLKARTELYSDEVNVNENQYKEVNITTRFGILAKGYNASDFNSTAQAQVNHFGILNRNVNLGLKTKALSKPHLQILLLIKQVEIKDDKAKSIAWFGDSLTNHAYYTQPLQNRIIDKGAPVTILNIGQSGNRLLKDGRLLYKEVFGVSALKRLKRDVFKFNNPDMVVVAVGINDLIHPGGIVLAAELPNSTKMINGYLGLLKIIKSYNAKAVITTITPFNGYKDSVLPQAEVVRQEVNKWIRSQNEFDWVFDLDEIVKDPKDPTSLAPQFKGDDNLHFISEGGQIVANKFNLNALLALIE